MNKHRLRYNWNKQLWEEVYRVPSILDLIPIKDIPRNPNFCLRVWLNDKASE